MIEQELRVVASFCGVEGLEERAVRERLLPLMEVLQAHMRAVRSADLDSMSPFTGLGAANKVPAA